jgi:iron complex outermembrane receptor protein
MLTVAQGNAAADSADAGAPGSTAEPDALTEIVVTAERRAESLQKSSLAIEVVSGTQARDAGFTQINDLVKLDPAIQVGQGGAASQIYIRGVGDVSQNDLSNPGVATNIDGVYIARPSAINGVFFDLARIEILKGPQGTLYGRDANGGAINILTNKPVLGEFGGHVEVEGGDYSQARTEGAINLPVGTTFAVRAAFDLVSRGGYDTQGFDDDHHQSGRLSALWQPSEVFNLRATVDYEHIGGIGAGYLLKGPVLPAQAGALAAVGVPFPAPRATTDDPSVANFYNAYYKAVGLPCLPTGVPLGATANGPVPLTTGNQGFCPNGTFELLSSRLSHLPFTDNRDTNVTFEANWDFDFATLTVLPALRQVRDAYTAFPVLPYLDDESSDETSLEARLSHSTGDLSWVSGIYLYHEHQASDSGQAGISNWDFVGADSYPQTVSTESDAIFGQATYSVEPAWRLIGGLRYTHDHQSIDGTLQYNTDLIGVQYLAPGVAGPAAGACFGQGTATTNCIADAYSGAKSWNSVTYKVGTEYDLTDQNMLYLTFATGDKSGGFDESSVSDHRASSYDPETLKALEVGSKNRFFDSRVQVNAEAFYLRYDDIQQNITEETPSGGVIVVRANVGSATIDGLNLDLTGKLTSDDEFHFGGEYAHSRFDRFVYTTSNVPEFATGCAITHLTGAGPNESIDCSGRPLTHTPELSGTAAFTHTIRLPGTDTIDATLAGQFASSRELAVDYTVQTRAAGYSSGDFLLAYHNANGRWSLTGYVHNFNNALIYTGAFTAPSAIPGLVAANLAPPRTYGARIAVDF